jgi:site-specific DNA-cytosine methylase
MGSDSQPYADAGYNVIRVGSDIGVENYHPPKNVHGIIANPPCTEFSFARTNSKTPRDIEKGLFLVRHCQRIIWEAQMDVATTAKKTSLEWWMLENPFGLLRRYLGHPVLVYQPFEYGDNYKKKTCVWGFFKIPKKSPIECTKPKFDRLKTREIHGEWYGKLTRQERRSICSPGFAYAFSKANP